MGNTTKKVEAEVTPYELHDTIATCLQGLMEAVTIPGVKSMDIKISVNKTPYGFTSDALHISVNSSFTLKGSK